jgi:catechol 2,3-dioxygenase-like lactoylglutathione lyase family enzyme
MGEILLDAVAGLSSKGHGNGMIVGVDHVQITVPPEQVEEARAFYCDVMGLREIEKPDSLKNRGGFWLEAGGQRVHVGVEEGVDRLATKAHVAYRVVNIDHWRKKLAAAGFELFDGAPIPGYDRFEFRDLFGNRVELISQTTSGSSSPSICELVRTDVLEPG